MNLFGKYQHLLLDLFIKIGGARFQVIDEGVGLFSLTFVKKTNYLDNIIQHIQFRTNWKFVAYVFGHN
jgi:hypothetical protein